MFNLENELAIWKNQLLNTSKLTTDDINELESHILDKMDELRKEGYSLERAFNISIYSIGSTESLCEEYTKVNYKTFKKHNLVYGLLGFILIQSLFKLIEFVTIIITYPFSDKLMSLPTIKLPIVNKIIVLLYGSTYVNNLSVFVLLFSLILGISLFSLLLLKKNSIIIKYFYLIEKNISKSIGSFILTLIIPFSLVSISAFLPLIYRSIYDPYLYSYITVSLSITTSILYLALIFLLINKLNKFNIKNTYIVKSILGYLIVNVLYSSVPSLLFTFMTILESNYYILTIVFYYLILTLIIYTTICNENTFIDKIKLFTSKHKLLNTIIVFSLVCKIFSFLILPFLTRIVSVNTYGEISYIIATSYIIIQLTLPIICFLLVTPLNIKSSLKTILYRN